MHAILWRVYGGKRVYMSTHPAHHGERIEHLQQVLRTPNHPLRAVVAHTGYGVHQRLPVVTPFRHFTLLRHPVDRVLSHYHYQIRREKLDASVSLETFVRQDLSRSCNVQTAFLGGLEVQRNLDGLQLSLDLYTPALLERAKEALRGFDAFGFTETFDESLLLFRRVFEWPWTRTLYVRRRVGRSRSSRPAPSRQALDIVYRYNELDLDLYEFARDLYAKRWDSLLEGKDAAIHRFRQCNRLYGAVRSVSDPLWRPLARRLRPSAA